jgi:hypothetical protein
MANVTWRDPLLTHNAPQLPQLMVSKRDQSQALLRYAAKTGRLMRQQKGRRAR